MKLIPGVHLIIFVLIFYYTFSLQGCVGVLLFVATAIYTFRLTRKNDIRENLSPVEGHQNGQKAGENAKRLWEVNLVSL